jgi:hypothetical protein
VGGRRKDDTSEKRLKRNAKRLSGSPGGAETNGGAQSSGVPGLPLSIEFCVDVSWEKSSTAGAVLTIGYVNALKNLSPVSRRFEK